jgi:hypothetical protein
MRRLLLILVLLCASSVFGATGDILDVVVNNDGWSCSNLVSGLSTGGVYVNGLTASPLLIATNIPSGSEKFVLNVISQGYDSTGTATTYNRRIVGTKLVRNAGLSTYAESSGAGGNLTNRFALSDWIYSGETITRDIASGWVTQGGNPNNASSGVSVVNNSGYAYPLVIGNWTRPGFKKVSGATMRLGFVAFHAYPMGTKPVACVKFIVTDQHGHTVTNIETSMRIDASLNETIPTGEYYTDIALAGFTAGDLLTCDAQAFPWIGNAAAVLDTSVVRGWEAGKASWHPITHTNVYDGGSYSPFIAVVDAVSGSDTTGRATNTTYDRDLLPFLTIGRAVLHIQGSNNAFASPTHNDPGGGTVYLHSNVISFPGSNPTINRSSCEVTLAPYPGEVVAITNVTTTGVPFGHHICWTNVIFANTNNYAVGWQVEQVVVDNCTIASTAAVLNSGVTNCWFENSRIVSNPGFFVSTGSPQPNGFLWRNCFFDGYGGTVNAALMMGCHRDSTNGYGFTVASDQSGFTETRPEFCVIYNNLLRGFSGTANDNELGVGVNFGTSNGCAVVQNVIEVCTNSGTPAITSFGIQDTLNYTNLLAFNNSVIMKSNWLYDDVGTTPSYKILCFLRNNYFTEWNIKTDIFGTPSANRIGNWSCMWGVGWSGNAFLEITNFTTTSGTFLNEFSGLNAIGENMSAGANGSQRTTNFVQWVNPKCWDGGAQNSWPGGGLYRIKSDSSLESVRVSGVVPFDIEGIPRGGFDCSGAYASASPRKGDFINGH